MTLASIVICLRNDQSFCHHASAGVEKPKALIRTTAKPMRHADQNRCEWSLIVMVLIVTLLDTAFTKLVFAVLG